MQEFCVCQRELELNTNDLNAFRAAKQLIIHLNLLLKKNNVLNLCAFLKLKKLKNAQILFPNAQIVSYIKKLEISFFKKK